MTGSLSEVDDKSHDYPSILHLLNRRLPNELDLLWPFCIEKHKTSPTDASLRRKAELLVGFSLFFVFVLADSLFQTAFLFSASHTSLKSTSTFPSRFSGARRRSKDLQE